MNSNEIRKAFLEYFESKNHTIVPSAPMVIKNDPTLMFTNAGMNQFKDIFLGNTPTSFPRAADSQKCLRVSGKHNDLEEVGKDTYHHTMFEMLGNWSSGDYFKENAIAYAWEFLTTVVKLSPDRLYATVFGGDAGDKTESDEEAKSIWQNYLPENRIIYGNKKDNFWEMGDAGPCGPCSEIHIDLRDEDDRQKIDAVELINKDHPLVIEIWNLVFIQFNRLSSGELIPLAQKHVDTGMGFERLCMAVQGKKSNYDTDVFQPYIQFLAQKSGKAYGLDHKADIAMRVCADHVRAVSFSIADGQLPSNSGQGYVILRILRRAICYGYILLGFTEPFMHTIVPLLVNNMGEQFPELVKSKELIEKVIKEEEQAFLKTLDRGIALDRKYTTTNGEKIIEGKFAFELFDTYGVPIDLTELMAKEKGLEVDMQGFEQNLKEQKERSRHAAAIDTEDWVELIQTNAKTIFVGYDTLVVDVKIERYRKITQKGKTFYQLVFNQTPFYAELGGQVGDSGYIESNGEKIYIKDTKNEKGLAVHLTDKLPENLEQTFKAVVDKDKRDKIEANHSATHLLHSALREFLGKHVEQKGSYVDSERLRFDLSHFEKVTDTQLRQVEKIVNSKIRENITAIDRRDVPIADAKALGAMALFSEKYGDKVRVMQFGSSIELCGGTHVKATGSIGFFKIVSEGAVAAGIRRIEAITGEKVEQYLNEFIDTIAQIKQLLQNNNIQQSLKKLLDENSQLKQSLDNFEKEKITR